MFEEITQADLVNKGVEGLPDTPNLETAEMQRKFDEITKEVIVPKFNALIQKLNNDLGSDISMIDPKDDTSKTLSALIGEIEEEVGLNTDDRHNHANKALLDSLTAILFEGYNRLVTMLAGVDSVTDVVTNDTTVLPSGKAIVDFVQQMGGGDMLKEVYDTDNDGVVDNADALNGHPDTYFATVTALQALGSLITALQSLVLAVGTSESTPADTWTALQALKGQNIARLQMNALGDAKIFKSADGGSTWDGGSPVGGDKSDLATIEQGTTATAPYAVGDHVVVNNVYHEVTAAIAIGDTFVEGTNIDVRTVGGEITALNQNLTQILNPEYIEVAGDGHKTLKQILEEIYSHVDISKITPSSKLCVYTSDGKLSQVYALNYSNGTSFIRYAWAGVDSTKLIGATFNVASTASAYSYNNTSVSDLSSGVEVAGKTYRLYYSM